MSPLYGFTDWQIHVATLWCACLRQQLLCMVCVVHAYGDMTIGDYLPLQHVDYRNSTVCGYLKIQGMTDMHVCVDWSQSADNLYTIYVYFPSPPTVSDTHAFFSISTCLYTLNTCSYAHAHTHTHTHMHKHTHTQAQTLDMGSTQCIAECIYVRWFILHCHQTHGPIPLTPSPSYG